tara:strand:- start:362 stop:565 length:204 start_codon:yes stop_codon:yes gene_type:complete
MFGLNNLYNTLIFEYNELYNRIIKSTTKQNIYRADVDYIKMEEGKLKTIYIKINEKNNPYINVESCV